MLKTFLNPINGSKVTAILLKGWILPVEGLRSTGLPRLTKSPEEEEKSLSFSVSVLLLAPVERFGVSRMRDYFPCITSKVLLSSILWAIYTIKFLFASLGTELSEQCAHSMYMKCGRAGSTCYPDRSAVQIMGGGGSGFSFWFSGPYYWDLILCHCEKISRKCQLGDW